MWESVARMGNWIKLVLPLRNDDVERCAELVLHSARPGHIRAGLREEGFQLLKRWLGQEDGVGMV